MRKAQAVADSVILSISNARIFLSRGIEALLSERHAACVKTMWLQRLQKVSAAVLQWARRRRLFAGAVVLAVLLWVLRSLLTSPGKVEVTEEEPGLADTPGVNGNNPVPTYQRPTPEALSARRRCGMCCRAASISIDKPNLVDVLHCSYPTLSLASLILCLVVLCHNYATATSSAVEGNPLPTGYADTSKADLSTEKEITKQ